MTHVFCVFKCAANQSAGSPVSNLFLKQATSLELSSLSPAPDWLWRFQSGREETFKHTAPLLCLPGSAQSRNQPCNSAQVRPRFTIPIAAMLRLTDFSPRSALIYSLPPHCTKRGREGNPPVPREGRGMVRATCTQLLLCPGAADTNGVHQPRAEVWDGRGCGWDRMALRGCSTSPGPCPASAQEWCGCSGRAAALQLSLLCNWPLFSVPGRV